MTASQIIAESELCKQAARNIYPQDPDELFNVVWLKIREREIQDTTFLPEDPKRYFLRALKNQVIEWHRQTKPTQQIKTTKESDMIFINDPTDSPGKAFIDEWLNTPTDDEDLLFLKNILTLALNCNNNKAVITMIGISDRQYYTYKKLAKQKLYDDYHASNISDLSGVDLV